jgi:hypothetical protein
MHSGIDRWHAVVAFGAAFLAGGINSIGSAERWCPFPRSSGEA